MSIAGPAVLVVDRRVEVEGGNVVLDELEVEVKDGGARGGGGCGCGRWPCGWWC